MASGGSNCVRAAGGRIERWGDPPRLSRPWGVVAGARRAAALAQQRGEAQDLLSQVPLAERYCSWEVHRNSSQGWTERLAGSPRQGPPIPPYNEFERDEHT